MKTKNKNKNKTKNITKNIVLLLTVILSFNIVSEIVVGQTETGTVTATVTLPGTVLNQAVPSEIIVDSDNYIKSFVGQDYFSKHFKLTGNVTMQSGTGEISYIVSYLYNLNVPEGYLLREAPIHVAVTLQKDGNIKEYLGPKKPHTFAMLKEQVIEIAKNNGIKDPNGGIDRVLSLVNSSMDGYVWVITGAINDTNIPGIYIDVDDGAVVSKFNSSSLIQTPSPITTGMPTPVETPIPTETPLPPIPTETPKSPFISGVITIVALLMVAFIVRHKNKV